MTTRLPLTVIGGYLGAGKTTLVNGILSQAEGRRFAVIVNDFGSINIDAGLIRAREGDTISLTNGCMCCSGSDGTAAALARILSRAGEFDHILIEASGVAEPGKIAQNAHGFRLPLEGVIVLADAEQIRAQAANRYVGDVVRRQLRQADLIVLNKVDLVPQADLAEVRDFLRAVAPEGRVIPAEQARLPFAVILGCAGPEGRAFDPTLWSAGAADHAALFRSWVEEPEAPLTRDALDRLAAELSRHAIRAKGHVALAEDPLHRHLYQQVGSRWTLKPDTPWDAEPPRTRIVAIALAASDVIGRHPARDDRSCA